MAFRLVTRMLALIGWCECFVLEQYSNENTTFSRIIRDIKTLEFCGYALAPRFTKGGFHVAGLPTELRQRLREFYDQAQTDALKHSEPLSEFIWRNPADNLNGSDNVLNIFDIENDQVLKRDLQTEIRQQLESWTGIKELKHTATYGIREYTRGAVLKPHVDRYRTHVLSAIVNVHQKVDEPWALVVFDHNKERHHVFMNGSADVVLYESATVIHGRPYPLKGDSFANLFSHFAPIGWDRSVATAIEACLEGTGRLCHDELRTCMAASFNYYAYPSDSFLIDACDHNYRRAFAS